MTRSNHLALLLSLVVLLLPACGYSQVYSNGVQTVGAPARSGAAAFNCNGQVVSAISAAGVPTCVTAPAATVTSTSLQGLSPAFNAVTAAQVNASAVADQAATNGVNGISNLVTGPCAAGSGFLASACDLMISPAYSPTETSRYFSPAKAGNDEQYSLFPLSGGIARARFAEDRRLGNRYFNSINPRPLTNYLNNDRTPFVWRVQTSNDLNYADNIGPGLFQLRVYSGHNYTVGAANLKQNFFGLAIDGQVRSGGQGGGYLSSSLLHTSPGDDMVNVVQHDSNGCAEGEDECNKLWRAFVETMTVRWGGTLNGTPVLDTAGFGNYSLQVTVGGGYNAQASGTDDMTVNLSQAYTTGNVTAILASPYAGTAMMTGDTAAAWATHFGPSVITTLTAAIDVKHYNGSCPATVLDAGPLNPNPFLSNENGVGGITAFCAAVASTAGLTDGQRVTILGPQGNLEMATIVHVVDGTHVTINVSNPHAVGETLFVGGAQGYGISLLADDIAPGTLFNYAVQPKTTLHKFFPIAGSDSSGHLFVYTNEARIAEYSTKGYQSTTPTRVASIGSISTSGTAVTAVNLNDSGDYKANVTGVYNYSTIGYQPNLSAPPLIWAGCTTPPTTTNTVVNGALQIVVTNGGNCSSPSATLSNTWGNQYRIAPLVMAKKVVNPATGSANDGYLLVGALDPTKWNAGDMIEQPGWIHDVTGSQRTFGKYYTGASRSNGIQDAGYFAGDYASPDTLTGTINSTDGHNYYADATHPVGPGVAYEQPPNGHAMAGDYNIHFRIYTPPLTALIDIACGGPQLGTMPYHPCLDNIKTPYAVIHAHSTVGEDYSMLYDPSTGMLSWNGPLAIPSLKVGGVAITPGGTENVIAYTAAPTLNSAASFNRVALAGAISPTIGAGLVGAKTCIILTHDATASTYPVTWPANIVGANQPGSTANSRFKQCFDWQPTDNAFVANNVGLLY